MKKTLLLFLMAVLLIICSDSYKVKEVQAVTPPPKPALIKDPLPKVNSAARTKPITHVVLHFTSNAGQEPQNPYQYGPIRDIFIKNEVSSHYLIDRKGEIYQLVPENRVAFQAGKGSLPLFPLYNDKLNDYSIGIEMMAIGTKDEMLPMMTAEDYSAIPGPFIGYTVAQYKSLNILLEDILYRNEGIKKDREHIIGHNEYAPGRKTDPGMLFNWSYIGF